MLACISLSTVTCNITKSEQQKEKQKIPDCRNNIKIQTINHCSVLSLMLILRFEGLSCLQVLWLTSNMKLT